MDKKIGRGVRPQIGKKAFISPEKGEFKSRSVKTLSEPMLDKGSLDAARSALDKLRSSKSQLPLLDRIASWFGFESTALKAEKERNIEQAEVVKTLFEDLSKVHLEVRGGEMPREEFRHALMKGGSLSDALVDKLQKRFAELKNHLEARKEYLECLKSETKPIKKMEYDLYTLFSSEGSFNEKGLVALKKTLKDFGYPKTVYFGKEEGKKDNVFTFYNDQKGTFYDVVVDSKEKLNLLQMRLNECYEFSQALKEGLDLETQLRSLPPPPNIKKISGEEPIEIPKELPAEHVFLEKEKPISEVVEDKKEEKPAMKRGTPPPAPKKKEVVETESKKPIIKKVETAGADLVSQVQKGIILKPVTERAITAKVVSEEGADDVRNVLAAMESRRSALTTGGEKEEKTALSDYAGKYTKEVKVIDEKISGTFLNDEDQEALVKLTQNLVKENVTNDDLTKFSEQLTEFQNKTDDEGDAMIDNTIIIAIRALLDQVRSDQS